MTQNLRVLVVDDEEIVCKRLQRVLDKMGCEAETFVDPQQALERLEGREFDLVITDVKMDEIDGLQVLERATQLRPSIQVVVITGYAMMQLARRAMGMGAFDFIAKPVSPDDVRSVVARVADSLGIALQTRGESGE